MAGGKLMIYDSKGNGYTEEQIARLMELLNEQGAANPGFWGRIAGKLVGENIALKYDLARFKEAGRKALALRSVEEDGESVDYPGHRHAVRAQWDSTGAACMACEAFAELEALCGKA